MLLTLSLCSVLLAAKEPTGDGALLRPTFAGAEFAGQDDLGFSRVAFPAGPPNAKKEPTSVESVEGYATRVRYTTSGSKRSTLEMSKNYAEALEGAGFKVLFSCAAAEKACPASTDPAFPGLPQSDEYYVLARGKDAASGDLLTVAVRAAAKHYNHVVIVRHKPMDTGLVKVDAAAMAKGLAADGHLALYGIQFDTGKATLKPESTPVLTEVAALLKQKPELKLHVVGHTDNVGNFDSNLTLSKARASAVVEALVKQFQVDPSRLKPHGVASIAPVSTNRNDDGRAQNRRVELVEM